MSHGVCLAVAKLISMPIYKIFSRAELKKMLTDHTKRFIRVLLSGEKYPGEYDQCKQSLRQLQSEILSAERSDSSSTAGAGAILRFDWSA